MEYEPEKQSLSQGGRVFLGAYDQRQGRLSFSLGPSTRATAYGCGHLLEMGVEQSRFSRGRAERSVEKSKGDEVGAPGSARGAHFLTRGLNPTALK